MQILSHRQTLTFTEQVSHKKGEDPYGGGTLTINPKPQIQEVPDWIKKTATFKAAVKSGIIVELRTVSAPVAKEQAEPETPVSEDSADVPVPGLADGGSSGPRKQVKISKN